MDGSQPDWAYTGNDNDKDIKEEETTPVLDVEDAPGTSPGTSFEMTGSNISPQVAPSSKR